MSEVFPAALLHDADALREALLAKKWQVATAESCTGGLLGGLFTELAGSSRVFGFGLVAYSNVAKMKLLGVPKEVLQAHGAVSHEAVRAMAAGAVERSRADLGFAISGIAGPGGGQPDKPVGTVYLGAWRASDSHGESWRENFDGDRSAVRLQTLMRAVALMRGLV